MDWPYTEGLPPASPIAASVEPFDDFLDAQRARGVVAVKIQLENEPYRFGFDRIDVEFLLDFCAAFLGFDQFVPEWGRCPVPETLAGVPSLIGSHAWHFLLIDIRRTQQ